MLTRNTTICTSLVMAAGMTAVSLPAAAQVEVDRHSKLCAIYHSSYEDENKAMSSVDVRCRSDESAPRETTRQLRMLNSGMKQLLLFQQILHYSCPLPEMPSGTGYYILDALICRNAQSYEEEEKKCNWDRWQSRFAVE